LSATLVCFPYPCPKRLSALPPIIVGAVGVKQVQHWLGHYSATFTLETYVGLLDEDKGEPLVLANLAA